MARPENLWLSPASLAKVDGDNYRAFIIDKAHLPFPENQSGSKRLIADTMMSVGIEVDPVDITYAPAPGDTRSGFVTVVIVAKVTDGAQLNAEGGCLPKEQQCGSSAEVVKNHCGSSEEPLRKQ